MAGQAWQAFWSPRLIEEAEVTARRWAALPDKVKLPNQVLGVYTAGCAATYGVMERCDFACTACYLANTANQTPALPFADVSAQLDQIRAYLGPWGNVQLTAGEVTLLPIDDLVHIAKYAHDIGLSAMLMTHGQNILQDPSYLERLMVEGGLEKVAIHVDTTQRGRIGQKKTDREADLHWIRDAMANLIRQARARTGRTLHASHTFTVSADNLDELPTVVRWCVKNADAFRMLSLQPTAGVGRTRIHEQINRRALIWSKVCEGLGVDANPEPMLYGHHLCNTTSLNFVVHWDDVYQVVEVTRGDPISRRFFQRLVVESLAGFSPDGESTAQALARLLGRLRQNPDLFVRVPAYCGFRGWTERAWLPDFLGAVARGRPWSIKPFILVIHNFMSAHELETEEGRVRLEACAFKVPVDGRMVSMCALNGTDLRRQLNQSDRSRLVSIQEAS